MFSFCLEINNVGLKKKASDNKNGRAVSEEQAKVVLTPSFAEVEKYISESHIVSCKSQHGISMMWTKDGNQITATKGRVHVEKAPGGKGIALFFENILSSDKGNYTCSATVDNKPVNAGFRLVVIKPIKFLDTSPIQIAKERESVVVRCEVEGEPEPSISWSAKGKQPDGIKYKVGGDGLAIENVTLEDEGDYHCRAFQLSNDKSNIIERTITLKVQHKPVWNGTDDSDRSYGFLTGTVNLTCDVSAEPLPKFQWRKDNNTLTPQKNFTIFDDKVRSTLQLKIMDEGVFDNYTCKASNSLGEMEHKISLLKGSKPEKPEVSVLGSTPDSIKINIEGPDDEELEILGYRVQFIRKEEMSNSWDHAKQTEFPKGDSPYTISGLLHNTDYMIRVAARNAAGFSDYTDESVAATDKVQADPVTGVTNTANSLSKERQLIAIFTLHNIILITSKLQQHL